LLIHLLSLKVGYAFELIRRIDLNSKHTALEDLVKSKDRCLVVCLDEILSDLNGIRGANWNFTVDGESAEETDETHPLPPYPAGRFYF